VQDLVLKVRSGTLTVEGKGAKWRDVPLNMSARAALRPWLEVRTEGDALFGSQKGARIAVSSVWRRVAQIGAQAQVEGLTPHRLRHSFAKNLVDAERPLNYVAKLLGHSSLQTTAIYAQPGAVDLARTVESVAWMDS